MQIIKPYTEILSQGERIQGMYRQIELAGRVSYKSEDKMTDISAEEFVDRIKKLNHGAVLEHGTVYLTFPLYSMSVPKYQHNKYSHVTDKGGHYYVTTNYRVICENDWYDDLKYMTEPSELHEKRVSVRFVCDRGVSHELVRHRVFSFMQESSRFCNYSKGKFGCQITFIQPSELSDEDLSSSAEGLMLQVMLENAETSYLTLIKNGWKPQQARAVLPNATKTEVIMTGFVSDWKHFFDLRCAASAHPDMRALTLPLKDRFIQLGYLKE